MIQFECPRHWKPSVSSTFGVGRIPFSHYCPSGVIRIGLPVWKWRRWNIFRGNFFAIKWNWLVPAKNPSQSLIQFDTQMTAKSILSGLRVDHQKVRRCFVRGFGGSQRRTFFHASGRRREPFTYDIYKILGFFDPLTAPCAHSRNLSLQLVHKI